MERRLFSQISRNWAAEPLTDYDKILQLIRATTTTTGLKVRAYLDTKQYPLKVKPSTQRLRQLRITRHNNHPEMELHDRPLQWQIISAPSLRALPNNLIVVPNAKLAQAIVTNYHLPEKRMSLLVPVSVSYECDPEVVERILVEEAISGAKDIPGLLAKPAPFVRFIPGFGNSSLDFTLICQVAEFVDQYLAQHELRKRIFKRFRAEGIEIPFPIRTVYIKGDGAHRAASEVPREKAAIH